ncbi:MAG: hypothetical protein HXX81_06635 [Campylobacterales bacterium]|nr:hypothetical protein [Campylobacterales bacterium]
MSELENSGQYKLTKYELELLREDFDASFSNDEFGKNVIKEYVDEYNYLLDPHTATCLKAYNELREKSLMTIVCSTAEWTKFSPTIINALNGDDKKYADIEALNAISNKLNIDIPECINALFSKPIIHDKVIDKNDITEEILKFLKG